MSAPQPPRCALSRIIAEPMDTTTVKRKGWHEQGILVVAHDDPDLNMIAREFVRSIGEKKYGKRSP